MGERPLPGLGGHRLEHALGGQARSLQRGDSFLQAHPTNTRELLAIGVVVCGAHALNPLVNRVRHGVNVSRVASSS